MLVGEHEALARNHGAGTSGGETHRGAPQAIKEGLIDMQAQIPRHGLRRRRVEGPHAFLGKGGRATKAKHQAKG